MTHGTQPDCPQDDDQSNLRSLTCTNRGCGVPLRPCLRKTTPVLMITISFAWLKPSSYTQAKLSKLERAEAEAELALCTLPRLAKSTEGPRNGRFLSSFASARARLRVCV